jgi:hypothetical protein
MQNLGNFSMEVLLDLELLPDDLNLEDPISLHDDDDSSRSILEH